MPNVGPGFYPKLLEVAAAVQMKPEDILNVMAVESGINPAAHNPGGDASGLLQFMPSTLKQLGFKGTHADFRNLAAEDQLDYVKRLILGNMRYNGGPFTSASQYYVANFLPVALKLPGIKREDPETVIVAKNPDHPHLPGISTHQEQIFYNSNPALDANHDGVITYGDIQQVLQRAAGGKNFQSALAQMKASTGYTPSAKAPDSMVASKDDFYKKYNEWYKGHSGDVYQQLGQPSGTSPEVEQMLNSYLQQIAASERKSKKLYKKYLPKNYLTIQIAAPSQTDAIEFARVASSVLDIELLADCTTCSNGRRVELECVSYGPPEECFALAQQLTEATAQAFETATSKLGGLKVTTKFLVNKRSSYQQLSPKTAEIQYRTFLLKFV